MQNEFNNNYFGVRHYKVKIVKEKISTARFIINVMSYAIFMWLILFGGMILIYVVNNRVKALKGDTTPPKYNAYVVLTGSMIPEIDPADVVLTKKVEGNTLKTGDIITFLSSDERMSNVLVTHRILNKYYDSTTGSYTYQTKGDANNTPDFTLAEEKNIIGKVVFKIPKVGYMQQILATKGGLIIIVLIPALIVLSYDGMRLFKNIIQKKKKKTVTIVR